MKEEVKQLKLSHAWRLFFWHAFTGQAFEVDLFVAALMLKSDH